MSLWENLRAEPHCEPPALPGGGKGLAGSLQSHGRASWLSASLPSPPGYGETQTQPRSPGREQQRGWALLRRARAGTPPHSPVSDPARVAVGALAIDVVAGVAVLAGGTELLAALAVEAGRAGLVTLGAIPARLAGQAAPVCHSARLQALALPTPAMASGTPSPQRGITINLLPSPRSRIRANGVRSLTASCSLGRRSQPGTARGSTCPGSPARMCRSRPPGCTCPCSTGSNGRSGARTSAPGTGSAP